MNKKSLKLQCIIILMLFVTSLVVLPGFQLVVFAQNERPEPAVPFDEGSVAGYIKSESEPKLLAPAFVAGGSQATFPAGGNRLVNTQNTDGGWGWPVSGASALNTVGPIAKGLGQAYLHTASSIQKASLAKAGVFLLAKTNNFSPSDGYLAAQLDQVFGGTNYRSHVKTNFYDPLAAGTYNRLGLGTLYSTASYVALIRNNRPVNLGAWDLGMGLVAAVKCGAATADWVAGVKAEIDEMNGDADYDVIGLAGAVYGLAAAGEDDDPTAGEHAAASSLSDLAEILVTYQIENGGFAWNKNYVSSGNETNQETAYAILALNEVDRAGYLGEIQGASDYLTGVQLSTGGWDNYPGDPYGENNELTGEALWGISTSYPEVWVCKVGNCGHPGYSFNVIQSGINAVDVGGIVNVLPGTYYENQIVISKAVTVRGAGAALTTIDGSSAALTSSGLVRILADGNVTFRGFTLKNAGKASGVIIGILAQSVTAGITYTISYNVIYGSNNDAEEDDYGFYSQSNKANLVFTRNRITQTGANNMVLEKHSGSSEVSFNSLDCGVYGTDSFFDMTYGGLDVTALQSIHHNTFDLGTGGTANCTGISFASSYRNPGGPDLGNGKFSNIEIKYNNISNVKANRRGISLWNGDSVGSEGEITSPQIIGNKITGISPVATGSKALQMINLISNAVIKNNIVTNVDYAFHGRIYTPGTEYPIGTNITSNAFTSSNIFQWDDPTNVLSAELNWWGAFSGPYNAISNPSGTGIPVSNNVDFDPWAKAWSAGPAASTHEIGETATVESNIYAEGVYGAQLRLSHDSAVLDWNSGTTNNVASTPPWAWDIVPENFVAVTGGRRVSGSMQAPGHTVGANLSGESIATWKYKCAAVGYSDLLYDTEEGIGTYLADINGFPIPIALTGDWVDCQASTASVKGYIKLQGRLGSNPSPRGWNDATVTLTCISSECMGYGPYTMLTDATGYYELVKTDPGTGITLGTYSANVDRRAYLSATKASNVVIVAGMNEINTLATAPTLLGGDANANGRIDVGDLSAIGGAFGTTITPDTGPDINGDGYINIFDLVLAGGNFDKTESTWTP
jgi:hypothetical protein